MTKREFDALTKRNLDGTPDPDQRAEYRASRARHVAHDRLLYRQKWRFRNPGVPMLARQSPYRGTLVFSRDSQTSGA